MELKKYTGGCHCKKVRYEVEADLSSILVCNCSHCQIKGLLLNFVTEDKFTLLFGQETLTEYRFNKKTIQHLFCSVCGVESFGRGENAGVAMIAVNVRCIDTVELDSLTLTPINGKDF